MRALPQCIIIMGPTASGKTALAFSLAQKIKGVVINGDSMQLYDGLRILTARPTQSERAAYPNISYKLDGILKGTEKANIATWLTLATEEMKNAWDARKIPIVVGGTGMYLQGLIEGISPVPEIPATIRENVRGLAKDLSVEQLQHMLVERDPQTKLYEDPKRLARALEVILATGKPIAYFQNKKRPVVNAQFLKVALMPAREALYTKIEARFDEMIAAGAIEEVKNLLTLNLPEDHPLLGAVGVKPFTDYLNGTITLEEAILASKQQTRNLAKRQMTWMRGQMTFDLVMDSYAHEIDEMALKIFEMMRS